MIILYDILIEKIKLYDTIIIHRHIQPDLDALGSQLGLRDLILNNFEGKTVYVVGDISDFDFLGDMDEISDDVFDDALAIVVDVAGKERVSDQRFLQAKETVVIDHHRNDTDFADHFIHDANKIAAAQMITEMAIDLGLYVDSKTATYLLAGIVTDSGRFFYPQTDAATFEAAAFLLRKGARMRDIYENLYEEDYVFKKLKGYFIKHFKLTKNNVAYMKNSKSLKDEFGVTTFTISRGMVNQMANIKGIPIWVNFTETDNGQIQCELRSKRVPIVEIAKKYGGGGHALACGCNLTSWDDTNMILDDLDRIAERINKNE